MRKIQLVHVGWQAIWLAVAKQTSNIWTGIAQSSTIVTKLLDQLFAGTVLTELVTLISTSSQADIRDYVHRSAIWALLPDRARIGFLRSTAIGLLTYESPEESTSELEPELVHLFNSSAFQTEAFYHPSMSLSRVIVYSKRFTVSEPVVLQYLRAYQNSPSAGDARAFGQLVLQKRWTSTADELFSYSRWNSAWQGALAECVSLLGMINRFIAYLMPGLSTLPSRHQLQDSWWKSLLAELQSVYYEGPLQDGLWEESGGENHEIKAQRTGGEQWVDALRKLRTRKTRATIELLLDTVTMHYPTNSTFTTLRRNIDHA
ncbi:effector-associated domain EAD1-containing protein [Hymenobacter defluvii]|uniref:Uncharacterized protein n=1 Tax=Hymenobacter defluvii TaxID=2054411 RepID=A0ABS3TIK3_9BACT|nr:effector-associated domain EAD1-containing protein [Hymenobacter defluvii]MBO3273484.1 hypothetical protein [Hymenobacter defluvii]